MAGVPHSLSRRPRRRARTGQGGQSVAEFAIVAVPLLLLLLGIVQFAFIYNAQIGLTNGIRDAARYGSTLTVNTDATASTAATHTIDYLKASLGNYVTPYSNGLLKSGTQACFGPYTDSNGAPAVRVTVTVVYNHPMIVPIIGNILDSLDGTPNDGFRITVSTDLRVDNPPTPTPALTQDTCAS